jgi:hypothetical protein
MCVAVREMTRSGGVAAQSVSGREQSTCVLRVKWRVQSYRRESE